ncbi:MAG: YciI family protein [Desulfobacterales bacterium]|nr:YciI family protein [Desulfobacterales bacterium]
MLFSLLIYDEPDTARLRDIHRKAHLAYLKEFDDQTLFAGPFTTDDESADLGSLRLIQFPDLGAFEKHIADEPYVTGGIQKHWIVNRWQAAVPTTWRDCPRTPGNIQAMFHGLDGPNGARIRREHGAAHQAYLAEHAAGIIARGPLLDQTGKIPIGSLWLLDVSDMDTARRFIADEPYNRAGCFKDVTFHRWRFGRVFDRFKV